MSLNQATFLDLQNRILQLCYGSSWSQEQYTYLTQSIGTTDLTFTVNDATQVSRGLIQVDAELMNVQTFSAQTNTVTIFPFGRGYYGSTAASHANQASLINSPKFTKIQIQQAINDIIGEIYPRVFAVATTEFQKIGVQYGYGLPATTDQILQVNYQVIGPSKIWPSMRRWRFDPNANLTDFPTGKAIMELEEVTPGRTIRVTCANQPQPLLNDTDGFAAVTGLPETCKDLVIYGAVAKVLVQFDSARLQMDSVEGSERAALTQPTSAANSSKYYMAIYQQRLDAEELKLRDRYPSFATQNS
jgi:hypothetical protein